MKHIDNFEKFNEARLKDIVVGGAIVGATMLGANAILNPRTDIEVNYTETDIAKFPEYFIKTPGSDENFDLTISEDGILGVKIRVGKRTRYTITVNEGTEYVYYKMSRFGEVIYATTNQSMLPKSEKIYLSDLEVFEETNSYKILKVPSFWTGLDFIVVNKNYKNTDNEFDIDGKRYTYIQRSLGFLEGTATFAFECK